MIKKATLSNIDQLSILFNEYLIFYKKPSNIERAKTFLIERIQNNESEIYVDEQEGKLTGFVQLYPLFSSTRMCRLWLLNDLYVNPTFRGKQISIALINQAKELAKNTNSAGLMLETAKTNMIGNNLYPKTGFSLDNEHNYYSWDV